LESKTNDPEIINLEQEVQRQEPEFDSGLSKCIKIKKRNIFLGIVSGLSV
jgi:hypothetical protein